MSDYSYMGYILIALSITLMCLLMNVEEIVDRIAKGEKRMSVFKMDNRVYDVLKWCCILFLPALAVLVKTVFAIWSIPYGEEISTTIMALDVFLASILGISHIQYKNGENNADG